MPSMRAVLGLVIAMAGAAPLAAQDYPAASPGGAPRYLPAAAMEGAAPIFTPSRLSGGEETPRQVRPGPRVMPESSIILRAAEGRSDRSPVPMPGTADLLGGEEAQAQAQGGQPPRQVRQADAATLSVPPSSPPARVPTGEVVPVAFESPQPSPPAADAKPPASPPPLAAVAVSRAATEKDAALMPASGGHQLPLLPPRGSGADRADAGKRGAAPLSMLTVAGSLGIVLGIFFLLAWGLRRAMPRRLTALPSGVVEILGRAPLAGRQQLHLLRCGNKLLLVSVTPAGAETLTEITDPVEVDRLAGLCQQVRPQSATAAFRETLDHFAREHTVLEGAGEREIAYDDYRLSGIGMGSRGLEERHG